jgi:hypothetical protein
MARRAVEDSAPPSLWPDLFVNWRDPCSATRPGWNRLRQRERLVAVNVTCQLTRLSAGPLSLP